MAQAARTQEGTCASRKVAARSCAVLASKSTRSRVRLSSPRMSSHETLNDGAGQIDLHLPPPAH
jgi:hypothetical protein